MAEELQSVVWRAVVLGLGVGLQEQRELLLRVDQRIWPLVTLFSMVKDAVDDLVDAVLHRHHWVNDAVDVWVGDETRNLKRRDDAHGLKVGDVLELARHLARQR